MLLLIGGGSIFASESAVRQLHREYLQMQTELDVEKAFSLLHPSFIEISATGKEIKYERIKRLGAAMSFMKNVLYQKITLVEFMEFYAAIRGHQLTDAERKHFRELEKTPEGQKMMEQLVPVIREIKDELDAHVKKFKESLNTYRVISCKVSGNTADLVYTIKDIDSDKMRHCTTSFIKVNGKWLLTKNIEKYID